MNNEKRVDKLEEQIGVNQKEETLEEMLQAFLREYCRPVQDDHSGCTY